MERFALCKGKNVCYNKKKCDIGGIFMSVDMLQEKIRKTKNPAIVLFEAFPQWIPTQLLEERGVAEGCEAFFTQLLSGLKGHVGAVRFGFGSFALLGANGLQALSRLLAQAKLQGFYVLLDAPEALSPMAAKNTAAVLSEDPAYPFDALVISSYLGSDVLKAYLPLCKQGKSLFSIVRTANKSAPEIQDLLTGGRLVHTAVADIISRQGDAYMDKCGFSRVGVMASASAADSLRALRGKYPKLFLLLDGYDYPNSNAKNCSFAFDKLGHGAAACAGESVIAAWKETESDPVEAAVEAVQRMKKNLTRYTTVL